MMPLTRFALALAALLTACSGSDTAAPDSRASDARGAPDQGSAREAGSDGPSRTDGPARTCQGPGEEPARKSRCAADIFTVGGKQRGMIVCQPDPLPSGPLPVVLGFHGGGGSATNWKNSNPWHDLAARHGFVFVYMQGCKDSLTDCSSVIGSYLWNVGKKGDGSTVDDQGYVLEALERLEQVHKLSIDAGCRFATGHSLGGIFSYSLLCDQPELLTAIGPISAPPTDSTCTPHGGTSIFHVHGSADANVPFDTGCCSLLQKSRSSKEYLPGCDTLPQCKNPTNWWPPVRTGNHPYGDVTGLDTMATKGLGCDGTLTKLSTAGKTTCSEFSGCAGGRAAQVCLVDGIAHSLKQLNDTFDVRGWLWSRFSARAPRQP